MSLVEIISQANVMLAEGSLIERLRRDETIRLDPHVEHAGLIYEPEGRAALEKLFRQYLDIGQAHDLPMVVCTTTWRANPERLSMAGLGECAEACADAFRFLDAIRRSYDGYSERIHICGLTGCAGDAYKPGEALSAEEAEQFHCLQASALGEAGVDFLMAATLPALSEAVGIARAMSGGNVPYMASFIVRPTGNVLDGTPLHEAVCRIDAEVDPPPLGYMVNCVHPDGFREAMERQVGLWAGLRERVIGLQANTSRRSPEELDHLDHLDDADTPAVFADAMLDVHRRFGIKILGGCCGTDDRHIREVAERIAPATMDRPR